MDINNYACVYSLYSTLTTFPSITRLLLSITAINIYTVILHYITVKSSNTIEYLLSVPIIIQFSSPIHSISTVLTIAFFFV